MVHNNSGGEDRGKMIKVVFDDCGFEASGHADFDEYGKDVVCAAVSSILQHSAYILVSLGGKLEMNKGYLKVWDVPRDSCARTVLEVTKRSILNIQEKYPENLSVEVI
jgi:uncharacterized protein YsxB (DUF464 family)